jgi:gluconate kinase
MKPAMLQSQLDTLEALGSDEPGLVYDIALPVEELVKKIIGDLPKLLANK